MNVWAINAGAGAVPIERLHESAGLSEKQKIREACRQFEAVLLRQILDAARKPLHDEGLEGSTASDTVYRDMITSQLAESISQSGSFGLARALEVEFSRQVLRPPADPADPLPATAAPRVPSSPGSSR